MTDARFHLRVVSTRQGGEFSWRELGSTTYADAPSAISACTAMQRDFDALGGLSRAYVIDERTGTPIWTLGTRELQIS